MESCVVSGRLRKLTTSREGWQCDEANSKRGAAWQGRLYQHNQEGIDNVLASQKDFGT